MTEVGVSLGLGNTAPDVTSSLLPGRALSLPLPPPRQKKPILLIRGVCLQGLSRDQAV